VIGRDNGVVFDWEPTLTSTAELMTSPRGSDPRLDAMNRPTRNQRREEYFERMDAKAEAREELQRERAAGLWADDSYDENAVREADVRDDSASADRETSEG